MTKEVWVEKGRAARQAGRHTEALKHFQSALELDKDCAPAWYGRAQSLEDLGRFQSALEALEHTRELDPEHYSALALFAIGNCHVRLGDRRRAIRCYDQALELAPHLKRIWHNRGTALFELGRYEEAAASYARELDLDPSSVGTQIWRAYCLDRSGHPEPASPPGGTPGEIATAWMQIGMHEYQAGEFARALAAYERAARANPSMGWAWLSQGACLVPLGRTGEALAAFDRAIALDDDAARVAAANRASLLNAAGNQGAAAGAYTRLLSTEPGSLEDHKAKVLALYASERHEEALESLAIVKRLDPLNAEAWYIEGLCLDALGRFDGAAASLGRFLELKPDHARAWFRRARALTAAGLADQALGCCDKAIGLGLLTAESWLQKGLTLSILQRYREALPCLDNALEQDPGWDETLYHRGLCHHHLGDHPAAIRDFDQLLEQGTPSRHSIPALYFKAKSLAALVDAAAEQSCQTTVMAYTALAEDRFDDALSLFRKALDADPANAAASLRLGALLIEYGTPEDAANQLAESLSLRPRNGDLWSTRGVVLARIGRSEESLECYRKALEVDPFHAPALRNSAIQLFEQGRFQDALDRYERALSLDDQNANAWYGRGVCLARLERAPEAVQSFRRAVEIAPNDAEAWHDLGTCLVHLEKYPDALDAWQKAAQLDRRIDLSEKIRQLQAATDHSGRIRLLSVLAYAHFRQNDFRNAAAYFDAALQLDPRRDDLWNDRGLCAEHIESPERAIQCFDQALAIDPGQPQTWYNKGVSLQHLRRFADAVNAFEKALSLHQAKDLPPDENLLHGHHNLGSCLLMLHKSEEALDHLDEVLALSRENPDRWREEARRAASLKQMLLAQSQPRSAGGGPS